MLITYDSLNESMEVIRDLQDKVSTKKYQHEGEHSFSDVIDRVCNTTVVNFKHPYDAVTTVDRVYKLLQSGRFIPAGSILYGLNNREVKCSLSNCYVCPIEKDSIEGIFDALKNIARTFSYRGGSGTDITILRPRNVTVNNAAKKSSGAVSFLPLISEVTNSIGQCISKDELVYTPSGFKKIGDVQVGDSVWTHTGFVRVINTIDSGVKETFVLKTKRGFSVQLTGDHTIANVIDGKLVEKRVDECVPGGQVLLSAGSACSNDTVENKYIQLSQAEYVKHSHNNSNRLREDVLFPEDLKEDFGWLLGYMYGNGCFTGKHETISISVPYNRPRIKGKVVRLYSELFAVNINVTNGDGAVYDLEVCRKLLVNFLKANGIQKSKSTCIEFPKIIMDSPKSVQCAFIAGFFDADGDDAGRKAGYRFNTTSYDFAETLRLLLLSWGICTTTHLTPLDTRRKTVMYRVSVLGRRSKSLLCQAMSAHSLKLEEFDDSLVRDNTVTPYIAKDLGVQDHKFNYVPSSTPMSYNTYERVKEEAYPNLPHALLVDEIECIVPAGMDEVCDITLEDVNYFWCNGIYVHNCGRRGALLASIDIRHPDVMRFIWCKSKPEEVFGKDFLTGKVPDVYGANLSVKLTDEFMQTVVDDKDWTFVFPDLEADIEFYNDNWNGCYDTWKKLGGKLKKYDTIPAREILRQISEAAHMSGDPGVLYIDTVINNTPGSYIHESLKPTTTNPCFAEDTLITTSEGPRRIKDLVGKTVTIFDGENWVECDNFRVTGTNEKLIRLTLSDGSHLDVTPYHTMYLESGEKLTAGELKIGDILDYTVKETHGTVKAVSPYLKGFAVAEGYVKSGRPLIRIYKPKYNCMDALKQSALECEPSDIYRSSNPEIGFVKVSQIEAYEMNGISVRKTEDFDKWCSEYKLRLPDEVFSWDEHSKCEFLAGLFDGDGTVRNSVSGGYSYQLCSVHKPFLEDIIALLKTLGVHGKIGLMKGARVANIKGKEYHCVDCWRINIAQHYSIILANKVRFRRLLSFANRTCTYDLKNRYNRVVAITELPDKHTVYCCTVDTTHRVLTSTGVITGNCGEQPLGPYNNCLLGAMVLSEYVTNPWTDNAKFDIASFCKDIEDAVVFMNIMSDINVDLHPLQQQRDADKFGKRIGIEFTALGDTFAMLGMRYGSKESIDFIHDVFRIKAICEIETSARLAMHGKCCPALETTKAREDFLNSPYIKNLELPTKLKTLIKKHGLANSAFNTVGPTGSISLMSNNCTSGIEPLFMFSYNRQTRLDPDKYFTMLHTPAVMHLISTRSKEELDKGLTVKQVKEQLNYYEANEISVADRIAIQAAIQKYTDASISSTVNLSEDTTVDTITDVYIRAWNANLKGITVFRDGCKKGVLTSTTSNTESVLTTDTVVPYVAHIRELSDEERSIRYRVNWKGSKMYVSVTIDDNDRPLEIFASLPRAAGINGTGIYSEELFQEKYSLWETITRMTSLALRANISIDRIISQLEKSTYSVVDAAAIICRILRKYYDTVEAGTDVETIINDKLGKKCQECGEYAYVYEGGCGVCKNCGYTTCG